MSVVLVLVCSLVAVPPAAAEKGGGAGLFGGAGEEWDSLGEVPAEDVIALDDLGISVRASDFVAARQEDGFVYIFTMEDRTVPYVMVGKYDFTADDFADEFTAYMTDSYPDLQVTRDAAPLTLEDGNEYTQIEYKYAISGYDAADTRLFREWDGVTYMFAAKTVPALGLTLPDGYMAQVAGSMEILASADSDYPLHVDSTRSIEMMPGGGDRPVEEALPGESGIDAPHDSTPKGLASGAGDASDENGYDEIVSFEPSQVDYEGTWVEFEDGFRLYLPPDWVSYELTDEERDDGVLYVALEDSEAGGMSLQVTRTEDPTVHSLEEIRYILDQIDGLSAGDLLLVNGIPCIAYTGTEGAVSGLTFFHPLCGEPYIINVSIGSCTENENLSSAILRSLSPAD